MTKGWRNESIRHSLASKGIQTSHSKVKQIREMGEPKVPPDELYPLDWDFYLKNSFRDLREEDKYDFSEKVIMAYWWASVNDVWDYFDIDKAIEWWYDFLYEYKHEWYGKHRLIIEDEESVEFGEVTDSEHKEFIDIYNQIQETYDNIEELIDEGLERQPSYKKIEVFEDVIHTYHWGGYIFNISELRQNFEEEYG